MLEQQTPGIYENPYKFNAKELDVETNLYYYGARYYNPRFSIWYGVDPLVVYNPAMETEFYGDWQHNGGVGFWGNLNPYIYTYQNPIVYTDPNGKQTITWAVRSLKGIRVIGTGLGTVGGVIGGLGGGLIAGGIIITIKSHQQQQAFQLQRNREFTSLSKKQQDELFANESFPIAKSDNLDVRKFPANEKSKITILNADYSNNDKKKVNNTEIGDIVQTPDSNGGNFNKRRDGSYENTKTGEFWSKSHTNYNADAEWKVGIGNKMPTKNNKITVDKESRKVIKINK